MYITVKVENRVLCTIPGHCRQCPILESKVRICKHYPGTVIKIFFFFMFIVKY